MGKSSRKESLPKGSASRAKGPVKATHKRFKDTSTDKSKDKPSSSSEDESNDTVEDSSKKGSAHSVEVTPAASSNKTTSKLPAKEGSEVKSAAGGGKDAGKKLAGNKDGKESKDSKSKPKDVEAAFFASKRNVAPSGEPTREP